MSKHNRYSREGWHPQGDDYKPRLQRGEIMGQAKGLKTMVAWEQQQKANEQAEKEANNG